MIVTTLTYQRIKDGDSEDVILIKGDPKTDDIQSLSTVLIELFVSDFIFHNLILVYPTQRVVYILYGLPFSPLFFNFSF